MKQNFSRCEQSQVLLRGLLTQDLASRMPAFRQEDLEKFGQRAAYRVQLRSPWTNGDRRNDERAYIERQVAFNTAYNEIRGGLPVCTTCTANCGNTVTGHVASSVHCPFRTHRNPYEQHSLTAAELISNQAAFESNIMNE